MSDSTISPVVVSMKKLVAPSVRSRSGRFWKPSTVAPSPGGRVGLREADELRGGLRVRHRVPGAERALHRGLELRRRDAVHVAVGDEVADRELPPLQRDRPAADARPELQVARRQERRTRTASAGEQRARRRLAVIAHPPGRRPSRCGSASPNASSASGCRFTAPRRTISGSRPGRQQQAARTTLRTSALDRRGRGTRPDSGRRRTAAGALRS